METINEIIDDFIGQVYFICKEKKARKLVKKILLKKGNYKEEQKEIIFNKIFDCIENAEIKNKQKEYLCENFKSLILDYFPEYKETDESKRIVSDKIIRNIQCYIIENFFIMEKEKMTFEQIFEDIKEIINGKIKTAGSKSNDI